MGRGFHFFVGVYKPNSVSFTEVKEITIYLGPSLRLGSSDSFLTSFFETGEEHDLAQK